MDFMHGFWLVTLVHLVAAASPGPDFIMVSQQTLLHGKRTGLWCAFGIALGLSVHIVYSALGMATIIANSATFLLLIKVLGGCYLLYLGYQGLSAKVSETVAIEQAVPTLERNTVVKGFLCNVLNPKAPLYFVALFTVVIKIDTPLNYIAIYGVWIMLLQFIWFGAVVLFLSVPAVNRQFQRVGHWIERLFGVAMVLLGIKVLLSRN